MLDSEDLAEDQEQFLALEESISHVERGHCYHIYQESSSMRAGFIGRMLQMEESHRKALSEDAKTIFLKNPMKGFEVFNTSRVVLTMFTQKFEMAHLLRTVLDPLDGAIPVTNDSVQLIMADTDTLISIPDVQMLQSYNEKGHQITITGDINRVSTAYGRIRNLLPVRISLPLQYLRMDLPVSMAALTYFLQSNLRSMKNSDVIMCIVPASMSMMYENGVPCLVFTTRQNNEHRILDVVDEVLHLLIDPAKIGYVSFHCSIEVSRSQLAVITGDDRNNVYSIATMSGASLHFPANVEDIPVKSFSPVIFIRGKAAEVLSARRMIMALSPIQLSFDVNNDNLTSPLEKGSVYREFYPQSLVYLRVCPSNFQPLTSFPEDNIMHYVCLATFECNLAALFEELSSIVHAKYLLNVQKPQFKGEDPVAEELLNTIRDGVMSSPSYDGHFFDIPSRADPLSEQAKDEDLYGDNGIAEAFDPIPMTYVMISSPMNSVSGAESKSKDLKTVSIELVLMSQQSQPISAQSVNNQDAFFRNENQDRVEFAPQNSDRSNSSRSLSDRETFRSVRDREEGDRNHCSGFGRGDGHRTPFLPRFSAGSDYLSTESDEFRRLAENFRTRFQCPSSSSSRTLTKQNSYSTSSGRERGHERLQPKILLAPRNTSTRTSRSSGIDGSKFLPGQEREIFRVSLATMFKMNSMEETEEDSSEKHKDPKTVSQMQSKEVKSLDYPLDRTYADVLDGKVDDNRPNANGEKEAFVNNRRASIGPSSFMPDNSPFDQPEPVLPKYPSAPFQQYSYDREGMLRRFSRSRQPAPGRPCFANYYFTSSNSYRVTTTPLSSVPVTVTLPHPSHRPKPDVAKAPSEFSFDVILERILNAVGCPFLVPLLKNKITDMNMLSKLSNEDLLKMGVQSQMERRRFLDGIQVCIAAALHSRVRVQGQNHISGEPRD